MAEPSETFNASKYGTWKMAAFRDPVGFGDSQSIPRGSHTDLTGIGLGQLQSFPPSARLGGYIDASPDVPRPLGSSAESVAHALSPIALLSSVEHSLGAICLAFTAVSVDLDQLREKIEEQTGETFNTIDLLEFDAQDEQDDVLADELICILDPIVEHIERDRCKDCTRMVVDKFEKESAFYCFRRDPIVRPRLTRLAAAYRRLLDVDGEKDTQSKTHGWDSVQELDEDDDGQGLFWRQTGV